MCKGCTGKSDEIERCLVKIKMILHYLLNIPNFELTTLIARPLHFY